MATPTLAQARNHYARQQRITLAAVRAVRILLEQGAPLPDIITSLATYQLVSATASAQSTATMSTSSTTALAAPAALAGASAAGFPLSEPLVALIDSIVPAPVEAVPSVWWSPAQLPLFMQSVEQLVASEVQDAGRAAGQVEFVARPEWSNYVRMLNPPSCSRCAILAGRIYRDLEAFKRHPKCDCVMVPVASWEEAHDKGYVSSAKDLFDRGEIGSRQPDGTFRPGLSEDDAQAIRDGADIAQVVNAAQGMTTVTVFGRRVKATTTGTTKRAQWRKQNPTRLVRLRPAEIYRYAKDRDDAIRLLRLYGYLLP